MKKLLSIILIGTIISMGSCEKFLNCELCEEDPNNPTVTSPDLLLPAIEVGTFSNYAGNLARLSCLFTQQIAGTDFQFDTYADYDIRAQDLNNEWNQLYADVMINCKELVDNYGEGNPHYRGIAKIFWAMNLGIATDLWGDVPYTEALQGLDNLTPAYDDQQVIIQGIQTLLDEAITDLSAADEDNILLPGSDDYVYDGDPVAWTRVAYVLKARYANRLSEVDAAGSATNALMYLSDAYAAGFTSTANDCHAIFGVEANENNQWYAFQNERTNYIKMGARLVNLMDNIGDPRLTFYATLDQNNMYSGTPIGSSDQTTSDVGSYFASPAAQLPMVTYTEAKFIEAEANFRSGNLPEAATAFNEAVMAHVEKVTGSPDPTFYAAEASETGGSITLETIMTHKYIASFTQIEVFADWRRTDIPSLTPDPDAETANNEIPRRLITCQDERVSNPNADVIDNLTLPVWWDQ